jgi:parvulin-like peptidyl-prolyl isomerase
VSLHLRRIAVPVPGGKGSADKARDQVRQLAARIFEEGLSFEDGVRKYSRVPGAKEDGGDLGYLSPQKLAPQVCDAVRNLEPGQASVPVVTGGYASIFYVEGRHGARSLLLEKKFTETRESLLKELRRKANVQIFDSRLFKVLPDEYKRRSIAR